MTETERCISRALKLHAKFAREPERSVRATLLREFDEATVREAADVLRDVLAQLEG